MAGETIADWTSWGVKAVVAGMLSMAAWLYRGTHKRIDAVEITATVNEKKVIALEEKQNQNTNSIHLLREDVLRIERKTDERLSSIERKMDERFTSMEGNLNKFWKEIVDLNKKQ